jgi:hypothetical protein
MDQGVAGLTRDKQLQMSVEARIAVFPLGHQFAQPAADRPVAAGQGGGPGHRTEAQD